MPSGPVSLEEYLHTSYEYDCEWVDGLVVERNGGEFPHAYALSLLCGKLGRLDGGFTALISVRTRTSASSIRVPDFTLLKPDARYEPIITHPPLLVIEVKAPEDTIEMLSHKNAEYRAFGIEHVWGIDPYERVAYQGDEFGLELVRTGELAIAGTPIHLVPEEIFAELDRP